MAAIQLKMSVEGSAYCTLSATGKFNFGFTSLPDVYVQLLEVWKGAMIVRLYIDDDGQSRFEDIELPTEDGETISLKQGADLTLTQLSPGDFSRDSPDQTNFPGSSSFWDTVKYNPAFQGRQMRPNSLKFPVFI